MARKEFTAKTQGEVSGYRWLDLNAKYQSWLTDSNFAEARR